MLITEANFAFAMDVISRGGLVGIDTETTGLNVRNGIDYGMGICLSVDGFDCYLPFRHKNGYNLPKHLLHKVVSVLEFKDIAWFHQKFEFHTFKTFGIDPLQAFKGQSYDGMILAHMVNEEEFSFELDYLAKKYLNESKEGEKAFHDFGKAFGYDFIPSELAAPYGAKDAQLHRRLVKHFWAEARAQELDKVYLETEEPFTRLLYRLEQRGVGVDTDFCETYLSRGLGRMETISRNLHFKPSSPKELGKYLLEDLGLPVLAHTKGCVECTRYKRPVHTHTGPPSFNKKAMEEYDEILQASNNPAAALVAEYRGWQKATSSLYSPLIEKVGPDGLIRTEFKQHGTVTGRLSANDPNLQQVPRESNNPWNGRAKSAFSSGREGYLLYGWDYSQLELRLAASYGRETVLLTEFEKPDADPFAVLAPLIFGSFTPEFRQDTKTFVYANLYGAGKAKIALQLGRPLSEVEGLYENYHRSIPGIMDVSSKVTKMMEQRGYIKYWDGRRRHMANKSDAFKAWNSLCQGGGAQLVKKAMLRCLEFEDENCYMVLQVHDEITFCIREDMIDVYEPQIKKAMTDWQMGVNLLVDGKEWK